MQLVTRQEILIHWNEQWVCIHLLKTERCAHTCLKPSSVHTLHTISMHLHTCTHFFLPLHTQDLVENCHALQTGLELPLKLKLPHREVSIFCTDLLACLSDDPIIVYVYSRQSILSSKILFIGCSSAASLF